jgi:hypothetical protein
MIRLALHTITGANPMRAAGRGNRRAVAEAGSSEAGKARSLYFGG